ncbi:MAG: DUF4919 domain-containing protein [Bacteroidales bacterium]|nr:DUF4919 domain-containing protein [Bacteroidales bacterium]
MKRIIFIFSCWICLSTIIVAQDSETSFLSEIKSITTDSTSIYYYPALLDKAKNEPGKLDSADCFYLYYGIIFQPKFSSIMSVTLHPERPEFEKAAMKGNCKKVIKLAKVMLERNPVDLTVLLHTSICVQKSKNKGDEEYIPKRFEFVLDAIFSTGDGRSKETAIKISNIEDEYVLKGIIGFLGGKETLEVDGNASYSVWEKDGDKLYFEDLTYLD